MFRKKVCLNWNIVESTMLPFLNVPCCPLAGVALGDSWISPIDYVLAWGPLLKSYSLVDTMETDAIQK